jgi:hypothetical protein
VERKGRAGADLAQAEGRFRTLLRDTQSEINVLRSQYRDKEATLAESSRLRMALKKKEREHDKLAAEIKGLCHG